MTATGLGRGHVFQRQLAEVCPTPSAGRTTSAGTSGSSSVAAVLQPAGVEKSIGIISAAYIKDPTDSQWQTDQSYGDWLPG
jgi:hypothetical protein